MRYPLAVQMTHLPGSNGSFQIPCIPHLFNHHLVLVLAVSGTFTEVKIYTCSEESVGLLCSIERNGAEMDR